MGVVMKPMTPDQQELVNANLNLAYHFSHQWQPPRGMCQADWTAECWYYMTVAAIKKRAIERINENCRNIGLGWLVGVSHEKGLLAKIPFKPKRGTKKGA
jgi:hypothetical protein